MNFKEQLKQLNDISQPNASWVLKNRTELLSSINLSASPFSARGGSAFGGQKWGLIFAKSFFAFYSQAAAVAVMILVVLVGSSGLAQAAKNTAPGQLLYPVKLALERTGLSLIPDQAIKNRVQMGMAGERLSDAQAAAENKTAGQAANNALDQFQNHFSQISQNLNSEQVAQTTPQKAAEFSGLLLKRNKDYQKQLIATVAALPDSDKPKAQAIQRQVSNSSLKAMEVLVASAKMGGVSEEKVAEDLTETVVDAEARVKVTENKAVELRLKREKTNLGRKAVSLDNPLVSTERAKQVLGEAKDLISARDLNGAISKVKESEDIMGRVEQSDSVQGN